MRTYLLAAAAAFGFASVPAQAAVNTPVPTDRYITVGGLDWAWASPCNIEGCFGGDGIDLSYQGTLGWRIPTLDEFIARPAAADFGGKCASSWFTSYSHCDFSDGANGYLADFGYNQSANGSDRYAETWLVRGASVTPGVPEAATWAMMIIGFGFVGASLRRRAGLTA